MGTPAFTSARGDDPERDRRVQAVQETLDRGLHGAHAAHDRGEGALRLVRRELGRLSTATSRSPERVVHGALARGRDREPHDDAGEGGMEPPRDRPRTTAARRRRGRPGPMHTRAGEAEEDR